jgi:hypothetical protein
MLWSYCTFTHIYAHLDRYAVERLHIYAHLRTFRQICWGAIAHLRTFPYLHKVVHIHPIKKTIYYN